MPHCQEYNEGYNASKRGHGILTSNYPQGSYGHNQWLQGFGHQKLEEIKNLKEENKELGEILAETRESLERVRGILLGLSDSMEKLEENLTF